MGRTLKDRVVLAVGAGLAVGAACTGMTLLGEAPWAHADTTTDQFIVDAHAAGFRNVQGDKVLLSDGNTVCLWLMLDTETPTGAAEELTHTNLLSLSGAKQFVALSQLDLCPSTLDTKGWTV